MASVIVHREAAGLGLTLPAETSLRLGLQDGQHLTIVEFSDGIKLVRRNQPLERQIALADQVLTEQAGALEDLSKR